MSNGERNHDPDLRELTADLDGLEKLMHSEIKALRDIVDERHDLYKERAESQKLAVVDALAAAKEAVRAALAAAEKAAGKTEEALTEYKRGANEWRDTVKDLIANLRESRSESGGSAGRAREDTDRNRWVLGFVASVVSLLFGGGLVWMLVSVSRVMPGK